MSIKAEVPLELVQSSLRSLLLEEDTEEDADPTAACKRSVYLCATACESLPAEVIQGADERVRWSGGTGHLVTLTVEGRPNGGVAQEVLWVSAISCFAGSKPNHCHPFSVAPSTRLHCRVGLGRPSHNTEMLANTALCQTEDQIYVLESQEGNLQIEMPISSQSRKLVGTCCTTLVGPRHASYRERVPTGPIAVLCAGHAVLMLPPPLPTETPTDRCQWMQNVT